VSGLVKPKEDASITSIKTVIGYTSALTELVSSKNNQSEVVALQLESQNTNVLTNTAFTAGQESAERDAVLASVGYVDMAVPAEIHIYPSMFEDKEAINNFITDYNATCLASGEDDKIITYADTVGDMMSSISLIISAITYILIAFVGVSLVVSSIMIGIITYISVIERTKEIGVLRSVGASKRDVKRVFTAESFIIGLASGLFGVIVAGLFTIPINILLAHFTDISGIASLPLVGAGVLVAISVVLTFIAGLIPARVAAKKDPVIALRSE
jgi:putative ABC transport system permease protein